VNMKRSQRRTFDGWPGWMHVGVLLTCASFATPGAATAPPTSSSAHDQDILRQLNWQDPPADPTVTSVALVPGSDPRACPSRCLGPVPIEGSTPGFRIGFGLDRSEFETDNRSGLAPEFAGELRLRREVLQLSLCRDLWCFEARISQSDWRDAQAGGTSSGFGGGLAVSRQFAASGQWTLGAEVAVEAGAAETDAVAGSLRWVQVETRIAAAWTPSPFSTWGLAPYGGVGFRYLDGVQRFDTGDFNEVDGKLPYAFAGAVLEIGASEHARYQLLVEAQFGDVDGLTASIALTF